MSKNKSEGEKQYEEEARVTHGPTKALGPRHPMSSAYVLPPLPPCWRERLKGMVKEINSRWRTNCSENLQGCVLNLSLRCQNPSLKRPPAKKGEKVPKGKRMGKLMLASVELTLQKVEMLGRARHRAREMLHVPTEVCAFLITGSFWWLSSLRYYFFNQVLLKCRILVYFF